MPATKKLIKPVPQPGQGVASVSLDRLPTTDEELWWTVLALWGIKIPRQKVCPDHCAPFTAFADAYFARNQISLWIGCIPGDSRVTTRTGPVEIEDIKLGTEVLGWKGGSLAWGRVSDRWISGQDEVLKIRTRVASLRATGKHRVLVCRKFKGVADGTRVRRRPPNVWKEIWVEAKDIVPGDFLVQPFSYGEETNTPQQKTELAEWHGLICGDGHVISRHKVGITHHPEASYMNHYRGFVRGRYGKELSYVDSSMTSFIYSELAATESSMFLGSGAHIKHVPNYLWNTDRETVIAFLRGYGDADGTVRTKDGSIEWYSCNYQLLEEVRHICLKVGLRVGSVGKNKCAGQTVIKGRVVTRGDIYTLRCYDGIAIGTNDSKYDFGERRKQTNSWRNNWRSPRNHEGRRYCRVLDVTSLGEDTVWDMSVDGTDTFVADSFVVHNSRGFGGKSLTLSILGQTEMTLLGAFVTILGGSSAQSLRVHETMTDAWSYPSSPSYLLARDPTKYDTVLNNGGKARTLMASSKSVRGPHPSRMRLDEVDEMEIKILDAAQGQPMRQKSRVIDDFIETNTVFSSTHQYSDGTVTELLKRAEKNKWPLYKWCLVAGTLVSTYNGQLPIEQVKTGDKVAAWNGENYVWSEVEGAGYTGHKETVRVTTKSGKEIRCTSDHEIHTTEGWVEAGSLTDQHVLVCGVPEVQFGSGSSRIELEPAEKRFVQNLLSHFAEEGFILRLWECETTTFEAVLDLLSQGDGEAQHGEFRNSCETPGRIEEGSNKFETGSTGSRTADRVENSVCRTGTNRNVCGGLPLGEGSSRSTRMATYPKGNQGAFLEETEMAGVPGVQSHRALVHEPASLVYATDEVAEIEKCESTDVFDVTVAEHHNFVANGILVHNCYKESGNPVDGWLTTTEIERKRSEIPHAMWMAEYDLQEPSFEGRAIDTNAVEEMFDPSLGMAEGAEGKYIEIEAPRDDRDYVTGVDWAKARDFTVIWTFDTTDDIWRTVAIERIQRRPWPAMVGRLNTRLARYGGKVAHDATGLGSVVDDYIEFPRNMRPRDVHAVIMGGRVRSDIITNYVSGVEQKLLKCPRIETIFSEHRFATTDDLYNGSTTAHLPDSISAGALAWSLRNTWKRITAPVNLSMKRSSSPWKVG